MRWQSQGMLGLAMLLAMLHLNGCGPLCSNNYWWLAAALHLILTQHQEPLCAAFS